MKLYWYHFETTKYAEFQKLHKAFCWQGYVEIVTWNQSQWECRMYNANPTYKRDWQYLTQLHMCVNFHSIVLFILIYFEDPSSKIWNKICTSLFIVVLFIIAKYWEQSTCIYAEQTDRISHYMSMQWINMQL